MPANLLHTTLLAALHVLSFSSCDISSVCVETNDFLVKETTGSHVVELTECNWLLLGVTGSGKSCLGNFLLRGEERFKESDKMVSETKAASRESATLNGNKICVIDTPGLGDTEHLGKHDFQAKNIAEDASSLITELTKIMTKGISAFLIVIPANVREHSGTLNLLDFMDILGNYWNHAILVLTHGKSLGKSANEQEETFQNLVRGASCPPIWHKLTAKVNARCVIVEAKEYRSDTAYTDSVISKLLEFTDEISQKHGPYHDDLHSIGNQAFENAKMQVRDRFPNLKSRAAEEAIETKACDRVKEVVFKLIRIKMAGGKDVDKLEEMAKLKATENRKLQEEAETIRQQYEAEQKKRQQAEEERRKAKEETIRADERRRIAEGKEAKERNFRIAVERTNEITQKVIQNLESERNEAKQRSVDDKRQKEEAVRKQNAAEQKLLQEKYKREDAEQSLMKEIKKRESEEREKEAAKQETQEEKRRRKNAEWEKTNAEQEACRERYLRQIAEAKRIEAQKVAEKEKKQREAAEMVVAERESDKVEFEISETTLITGGGFALSQQLVRVKRSND